ncbi:cell surface protein [Apodospora peruviana]|uniref:Cell surface protein n=1 Tax=Apodospora peruviana TaxID=516989 RepID=A0AAE0M0W7_9PEZI|nr:cell surface protein [Apodospora peruviana]
MASRPATPPPCVVMPLYIYPLTETTWKPLYEAIEAHPYIDFLVIVNPNSGPGDGPLPGADYEREVPKLNAFRNVRTVGYIRIDYCRRPLQEVCAEVQRYANWKGLYEGLYVEGIFVDESPNHFSDQRQAYLKGLTEFIKNGAASDGLCGERWVIHNPGTPPEGTLEQFGCPDIICACEEPYHKYCRPDVQHRLDFYHVDFERNALLISGIGHHEIEDAVEGMCGRGRYIFATDLVDNFYESFGQSWERFVRAVAAGKKRRDCC